MSDTLLPDDLLLQLLAHGHGDLVSSHQEEVLTLVFSPDEGESLAHLQQRVQDARQPGDMVRFIVRQRRVAYIEVIRRQSKAPA